RSSWIGSKEVHAKSVFSSSVVVPASQVTSGKRACYNQRMHFLDLTLPSLAENLALDEALLLEAEEGRGDEVLRVWEWRDYAVVLGAGCRLAEDVNEAACLGDGIPILRRASGGGTVLLG